MKLRYISRIGPNLWIIFSNSCCGLTLVVLSSPVALGIAVGIGVLVHARFAQYPSRDWVIAGVIIGLVWGAVVGRFYFSIVERVRHRP